ncbi:MAG: PEP-CTERM sorting domain-containing protein, partial [Gemmatimonadales bacterium]|nr:PEP-CTERM sorting domain-containing protein [Gemmatimonadales bacterium]
WGEATDINDSGQVVGWSKLSDTNFRALLWDADGGMSDLNDLLDGSATGWTLASAEGINNLGQIAGVGFHDGQVRAFLLTPVPEPSSALAVLYGLGGLGGLTWRRR